jgi:hypothetical protein
MRSLGGGRWTIAARGRPGVDLMQQRGMLALLLIVAIARPAGAATLSIVPSSLSGVVGSFLSLDLVAADLGGEVVGGYSLGLTFDASIASPSLVTFGSALGDPLLEQVVFPDPPLPSAVPGILELSSVSLLSASHLAALQSAGSVVLASVSFELKAPGATSISVVSPLLVGGSGPALGLDTVTGAQLVAAPVPEPAGAIAFALGLAICACATRRRPLS